MKWMKMILKDILMIVWLGDLRKFMMLIFYKIYKKINYINLKLFFVLWGELYIDSEKCYGMKLICLYYDKLFICVLIDIFKE